MATFNKNNAFTSNNWGVKLWDSISKWLTEWENLAKIKKEDSTKNFFENKQKITNDITTWKITSWNKAQDTMAVRTNNIVQAFSAYALKKWANPDKVKELSKNSNEVIKRLTSQWWKKAQAINDYLMKWWYAERAVNYAVWLSDSPYDKTYEEKNMVEKGLDKMKNTAVWNFVSAAVTTPIRTLMWLWELADWGVWKVLWVDEDKKKEKLDEQYNNLSSQWYNSYKSTGKGNNDWETYAYKNYDKELGKWFEWSIEEYVDYKRRENEWIENLWDATKKYLETVVYDPKKESAWLWKFGGELLELAMMPASKLKYAKELPGVWKYIWKVVEYLWEKTPSLITKWWKADKFIESVRKWAADWVELQALDDLYEWELSKTEKYAVSSILNTATRWILNWVWKSLRYLLWPSWAASTAIGTKTAKEWNEMTKIVDNARKDLNAEVTPANRIADKLTEAWDSLYNKRLKSWKVLEDTLKNVTYWDKRYTVREVMNDIQNAFSKLKEDGTFWENAITPEFSISKSGKTLTIKNPNMLNNIRTTDWTIKLWDELKRIWKETFVEADKNVDSAQVTREFLKKVKSVLKDRSWDGSSWEWLKTVKSAIKDADKSFADSLEKKTWDAYKKALAESEKDIKLSNAYEDLIWRLDWRSTTDSTKAAEKAMWWDAARRELFRQIKKETWIDMNNEIWAWIANMSQFSSADAKQLADMIYPSAPWLMEFALKNTTWWARRLVTPSYTKDFADKTVRWQINKYLGKWVNVAGNAAWLTVNN